MQKKYKGTLKSVMIITAVTLMACSFGCKETPDATPTPIEKVNQTATKAEDSSNKPVKETADATTIEKMNQTATKAGDSLNKTVKNASVKASEVATEAGDTINKTIETVSEKISDKISKEDK